MSYNALSVVNKLIDLSQEASGASFTPMQLLKLTYYAHAWMLELYGRPLLNEPIWAWQYGPVIPDVYYALRHYGGNPVMDIINGVPRVTFNEAALDIIKQVFAKYGKFAGIELSAMTHAPGIPYEQVWRGTKAIIPNQIIQSHYAAQAQQSRQP